jgi:hypothetical protein
VKNRRAALGAPREKRPAPRHPPRAGLAALLVASLAVLVVATSGCSDGSDHSTGPVSIAVDPETGAPCADPPLQRGLEGDATADANAGEPLFRRILVPGITDVVDDNGALPALVDLDRDGRTDVVLAKATALDFFHNRGCFRFVEEPLRIDDSRFTIDDMPAANQSVVFADLNEDGFLDGFVTGPFSGNELLLSQGRHDVFRDVAPEVGLRNAGAYNRQSQLGDVDGDGHLDIAIGADQIGIPGIGTPYHRLFVFAPEDGVFRDIGGTDAVPGFGGAPNCDPDHDRNSPGILLRDLAGQGALDLVQGYHNDMAIGAGGDPCVTGERTFGMFAWRNLGTGPDGVSFAEVPPGESGLTDRGKMRFDAATLDYEVVSHGVGLPYLVAFDAFNTGRLDVLAVGPTDPAWHVNSDQIAGRFYRNLGDFRFADATSEAGLDALNWTYGDWSAFWDAEVVASLLGGLGCGPGAKRKQTCARLGGAAGHQIYGSSVVWGDFDNDGFVDFVLCDRREGHENAATLRNVLFRNEGTGRFAPVASPESGLDTSTESLEAADLDGDGLLDLVAGVQPLNSFFVGNLPGLELPPERFLTKVYWNTGAFGGTANHWVEVKLAGLPDRLLIGAQLTLLASGGTGEPASLGRRDYFPTDAFKASHELIAHWGLGRRTAAHLRVRLPSGEFFALDLPCVDARLTVDVPTRKAAGCERRS